ncbi:MFS transporter [Streptomyces spiramenti]|uniref:MFS transporter n=1 Tax=Streptomyces spiramenti TaxID=2720606 RepID=UPI001FD779F3|nr:MFS transporter [Streptomyces spiramenti]
MRPSSEPAEPAARPMVQWDRVGVLVGGQALAQGGSFILIIAMTWTAVQLGGTAGVSAVLLASSLPRALMLIFGGAVADMLGPRFVLLRTTAARAVVLFAGALLVFSVDALWPLVVIAVLEGSLLGLGGPASSSLMPHFAKKEHLARANSLYAMVVRLAPIAGAPLGALLIATGHLGHALLVTAGTCTAWLLCLLYVTRGLERPDRDADESMVRRSADGIRLLVRMPRLRWMFVAAFTLDLAFNWPLEVALPLLVSERGWNVSVVGAVIAAFGAGALVASALGVVLAHRVPLFARLVVTGTGIAAGILTMALLPSALGLGIVACLVGLLSGFNGPAIVTVYQQAAPPDRMGAAMSTLALAGIGTAPVSIALFSSLSLLFGVSATWVLCGLIAFISPVAAFVALRKPEPGRQAPGTPDAAPAGDDDGEQGARLGDAARATRATDSGEALPASGPTPEQPLRVPALVGAAGGVDGPVGDRLADAAPTDGPAPEVNHPTALAPRTARADVPRPAPTSV